MKNVYMSGAKPILDLGLYYPNAVKKVVVLKPNMVVRMIYKVISVLGNNLICAKIALKI